jgi:hypothetical protein
MAAWGTLDAAGESSRAEEQGRKLTHERGAAFLRPSQVTWMAVVEAPGSQSEHWILGASPPGTRPLARAPNSEMRALNAVGRSDRLSAVPCRLT